ncbi:ricin-type beta-trefoil lectin domain protein [Actinoplanes sp. L3-i22]|uniref:ricin-type beta-trefoil lectin domain protein n=1 Tax=Actinoplanes sp. L3-i22 TaxID=2836373 RepID=UPI001C77CE3D|nr:ricin-type beta-trefoil lectin domain protein [Actinoplanes sp. L3-i22]BCY11741.1 glucosylceramidase [Actinoplanes sp. L3-i22]
MTRPRLAGLMAGLLATAGLFVPQAAAQAAPAASVQAWFSSESRTAGYEPKNANWYTSPATGLAGTPYQLSRQADIATAAAGGTATISVDTGQKFQTVLGVGSSLEESTVFNLARMSATGRTNALRALVDPSAGAGFNVARITFGTSDFTSHDFYTYDDGAADPSLSRFSIQRDIDYKIISTLREALAINPNLKIFASAWSAPPWMKTSNAIITGSLLDQHVPTLATYYRKAIQAYAAQGIPIYGLTLQNEPLFEPADYPGMKVSADQERRLAIALRTELTNNGLGATKIWAFDHNFSEGVSYTQGVLTSDARASVDGIAFHDYAGDPSAMATVKAQFPEKDVLMTERSVWGTSGADRVVQYFRNQATLYEGWVSMLDQNRSPERWSGSPDPTMLVQSASNPDTFWKTPDYNMIAQFSKFVQAGAKRVATGYGSTGTVTDVSFVNPDNSLVTVVVNQTAGNQTFTLRAGTRQFTSTLPAKTTGTYVWAGAGDAGTTPSRSGPITGLGGKCVDVPSASTTNGTQVQLWTCNASTAQTWTIGSDNTVRALGKCLDVNAASTTNGTKVQIYDCNGSAAQQWTAGTDGTLRSLGKCLDATGPSSADGTKLQLWDCFAGDNQRWVLP